VWVIRPHLRGRGWLIIDVIGSFINVGIDVGEANGKPTVSATSASCEIGKLRIREHGGPRYSLTRPCSTSSA
jgi:hypothetical protein